VVKQETNISVHCEKMVNIAATASRGKTANQQEQPGHEEPVEVLHSCKKGTVS
jgi:hypothetical protein